MKVSIIRGGGLAGLVTKTDVDADALAVEDANELRAKVEQAGVFDLPGRLGGGSHQPDQADRFQYKVTVEDEGREHTVLASEEALPPEVRSLVSWVKTVPGRQEHVGPPGAGPSFR